MNIRMYLVTTDHDGKFYSDYEHPLEAGLGSTTFAQLQLRIDYKSSKHFELQLITIIYVRKSSSCNYTVYMVINFYL